MGNGNLRIPPPLPRQTRQMPSNGMPSVTWCPPAHPWGLYMLYSPVNLIDLLHDLGVLHVPIRRCQTRQWQITWSRQQGLMANVAYTFGKSSSGIGPLLAPVGDRGQHLLEARLLPDLRQMRTAAEPVFPVIAHAHRPVC